MFCNTIGALLTNHMRCLSCPQSPVAVHATARLLKRVVTCHVGVCYLPLCVGCSCEGTGRKQGQIFLVGCFLRSPTFFLFLEGFNSE